MVSTDSLADMLTRIRNGQSARLVSVVVPFSRFKTDVLSVLLSEGYISGFKTEEFAFGKKNIIVDLSYSSAGMPAIKEIKKMSKPGKRLYVSVSDLLPCYNGMGVYIVSTSKGVVSDRDARSMGLGGELLCKVF